MHENIIGILYGGKSTEHEISIMSAASIVHHIDRTKWKPLLLPISRDGHWHVLPEETTEEILRGKRALDTYIKECLPLTIAPGRGLYLGEETVKVDLVFPVLHGAMGEDGTVQGLLELCDIPYVGAGVLGSALGMDKEKSKEIWMERGLPVVPFISWRKPQSKTVQGEEYGAAWEQARKEFGLPIFVKPAAFGSSVGVEKVATKEDFFSALDKAFSLDKKVLIEPAIRGKEIECSVLGNRNPRAFFPGEIIPNHDFYDYQAKYTDPEGAALIIPADISESLASEVMETAVEAFLSLEGRGFSRVDFFVDPEQEKVYLNEINTLPGFTKISMFPRMCEAGGLSYSDLVTELIELGFEEHSE